MEISVSEGSPRPSPPAGAHEGGRWGVRVGAAPTAGEVCGDPRQLRGERAAPWGRGEGSPHRRPAGAAMRPPRAEDPGGLRAQPAAPGKAWEARGTQGLERTFCMGKGRSPCTVTGDPGTPPLAEVWTQKHILGHFLRLEPAQGNLESPVGGVRGAGPRFGEWGCDPPEPSLGEREYTALRGRMGAVWGGLGNRFVGVGRQLLFIRRARRGSGPRKKPFCGVDRRHFLLIQRPLEVREKGGQPGVPHS